MVRREAILTRRGKTIIKAESACLKVAYKRKNWNLVSLSKKGLVEGTVGVSVSELFALDKSTLPGFLSRRLATGITLRDLKYWPYEIENRQRIAFHVSGYIVPGKEGDAVCQN